MNQFHERDERDKSHERFQVHSDVLTKAAADGGQSTSTKSSEISGSDSCPAEQESRAIHASTNLSEGLDSFPVEHESMAFHASTNSSEGLESFPYEQESSAIRAPTNLSEGQLNLSEEEPELPVVFKR